MTLSICKTADNIYTRTKPKLVPTNKSMETIPFIISMTSVVFEQHLHERMISMKGEVIGPIRLA
jgi:hypothetical protein